MDTSRKPHILSGGGTFPVSDIESSISWYTRLGFEVEREYRSEAGLIYVHLRLENARLLLLDQKSYEDVGAIPPNLPLGNVRISIQVSGLHELRKALAARYDPLPSLETNQPCLELRFPDPDGYEVVFFEWL